MPSAATFSIPPIRFLIERWLPAGDTLDPFARGSLMTTVRNDIDPAHGTEFTLDAREFLAAMAGRSFAGALMDPPYSPRHISECYKAIGRNVSGIDTQNAALYSSVRDLLAPLIEFDGIVISFGWNSVGMGIKRGFAQEEILLVCHGAAHNDTICVVERKVEEQHCLPS